MRKYITSIILGCTIFAACTQEESYSGNPETITVDAAGYFRGVYQEGAVMVYDTEYTLANIHPYFKDFEMLISGQDANNSGLIITDIDCPVYIVAPASPTPSGWRKVTDSSHEGEDQTMRYITSSSKVDLAIFTKRAYAGVPVQIPVLNSVMSATPIARKIILLSEENK